MNAMRRQSPHLDLASDLELKFRKKSLAGPIFISDADGIITWREHIAYGIHRSNSILLTVRNLDSDAIVTLTRLMYSCTIPFTSAKLNSKNSEALQIQISHFRSRGMQHDFGRVQWVLALPKNTCTDCTLKIPLRRTTLWHPMNTSTQFIQCDSFLYSGAGGLWGWNSKRPSMRTVPNLWGP